MNMLNDDPPAADRPTVGDCLGGRYTLLERLGGGGQGDVFRARDDQSELRQLKVIKVSRAGGSAGDDPCGVEARALVRIRSPYVIALHEYGREDRRSRWPGLSYLVLQDLGVDYRPLVAHLADAGLGFRQTVAFARQLAIGLRDVHDAGVCHGDLKPANVMVRRSRRDLQLCLIDFAASLERAPRGPRLSSSSRPSTKPYAPPERADTPVDPVAIDVYGYGMLVYEALTGVRSRSPAFSSGATWRASIRSVAPTAAGLKIDPAPLDEAFGRLLSPAPQHRPETIEAAGALMDRAFSRASQAAENSDPPRLEDFVYGSWHVEVLDDFRRSIESWSIDIEPEGYRCTVRGPGDVEEWPGHWSLGRGIAERSRLDLRTRSLQMSIDFAEVSFTRLVGRWTRRGRNVVWERYDDD